MSTVYTPRLKKVYFEEVVPQMVEKYNYKSVMQVPRLLKIVINQGLGIAVGDKKIVDTAVEELSRITGQRAVPTRSKKAISNFKLREDMPIGAKVTLRSDRMYEFLDRLLAVALPAVRDFKGINDKAFDGRGNFTMGITEQIIFPEIDIDKISRIQGMDVTLVTTALTDDEAYSMLSLLGVPFKKK
jgi:large subunit ribosomal protein L5